MREIRKLQSMDEDELFAEAKRLQASYELLKETAKLGRLPVVNFAAGGVATPADAALMMQLGMDGVFVGSVLLLQTTSSFDKILTHYLCVFFPFFFLVIDEGNFQEWKSEEKSGGNCEGSDALQRPQSACRSQ
jgi:hypothetical protein